MLSERSQRTRDAILEASRRLFLEKGYAGARIADITDACGISRAGFYTYFDDKRQVFDELGDTAYRDITRIINAWRKIPASPSTADVVDWLHSYLRFMQINGAFVMSTLSGPDDERRLAASRKLEMKVARELGRQLQARQVHPTDDPDTLGLVVLAMLDRSWFQVDVYDLPVDLDSLVTGLAKIIIAILA